MVLLAAWYVALLAYADLATDSLEDARYIVLATVPFAFLAGLLRSRVAGASTVSEVVATLGDPSARTRGIGPALGAPRSSWRSGPPTGASVNEAGASVKLPPPRVRHGRGPARAGSGARRRAVYDASRQDERELVRAVAAARR